MSLLTAKRAHILVVLSCAARVLRRTQREKADDARAPSTLGAVRPAAARGRLCSRSGRIGLVRSFGGATELEPVAPPPAPRRIFCLSAVPCNAAPQGFLYGSAASARGQHDGAKRIVRAVLRF